MIMGLCVFFFCLGTLSGVVQRETKGKVVKPCWGSNLGHMFPSNDPPRAEPKANQISARLWWETEPEAERRFPPLETIQAYASQLGLVELRGLAGGGRFSGFLVWAGVWGWVRGWVWGVGLLRGWVWGVACCGAEVCSRIEQQPLVVSCPKNKNKH